MAPSSKFVDTLAEKLTYSKVGAVCQHNARRASQARPKVPLSATEALQGTLPKRGIHPLQVQSAQLGRDRDQKSQGSVL